MGESYATQPILTQRFVSHLPAVASLALEMGGSEGEPVRWYYRAPAEASEANPDAAP